MSVSTRIVPGQAPRKRRRIRNRPEQALQRACVDILHQFVPPPPEGPFWTAINPVPAKSKIVAALSKAMGLRPGVPDFWFLFQGKSIVIEMKAGRGSLSPAQRERRYEIIEAGGIYCWPPRTVAEFVRTLHSLGIPCRCEVRGLHP